MRNKRTILFVCVAILIVGLPLIKCLNRQVAAKKDSEKIEDGYAYIVDYCKQTPTRLLFSFDGRDIEENDEEVIKAVMDAISTVAIELVPEFGYKQEKPAGAQSLRIYAYFDDGSTMSISFPYMLVNTRHGKALFSCTIGGIQARAYIHSLI